MGGARKHLPICLNKGKLSWGSLTYERGSDNDTSAKIPSEKVHIERYTEPWKSFGDDGKESRDGGANHYNKECRYPSAQLSVVVVSGCLKGTIDVPGIGGGKINVTGVESGVGSIASRHGKGKMVWSGQIPAALVRPSDGRV